MNATDGNTSFTGYLQLKRMLCDTIEELTVISAAINLVIAIVKFATPLLHFHLCLQKAIILNRTTHLYKRKDSESDYVSIKLFSMLPYSFMKFKSL